MRSVFFNPFAGIFFLLLCSETCYCQTCSEDQFECDDGACIPESWHCDGGYDCSDYSDEIGCPCDGFLCSNGMCILNSQVKDFKNQCIIGSVH